jgi:cell division protein FtsI/penicillin-binding protein 2
MILTSTTNQKNKTERISTENYIETTYSTTYKGVFYDLEHITRSRNDPIWYSYQWVPKDPLEIKLTLSSNIQTILQKFIDEKWYTATIESRQDIISKIKNNQKFLDINEYLDHIDDLTAVEMKIQFMLSYLKDIIEE